LLLGGFNLFLLLSTTSPDAGAGSFISTKPHQTSPNLTKLHQNSPYLTKTLPTSTPHSSPSHPILTKAPAPSPRKKHQNRNPNSPLFALLSLET
jgi:hypothetical protein